MWLICLSNPRRHTERDYVRETSSTLVVSRDHARVYCNRYVDFRNHRIYYIVVDKLGAQIRCGIMRGSLNGGSHESAIMSLQGIARPVFARSFIVILTDRRFGSQFF